MLQSGSFLEDVRYGERRFRIKELLFDAGDYQIALAEDTAMDDKLVCAKTIAYDATRTQDKKYVALRRKALHEELQFLARPIHLLPEPLDWIQLDGSDTVLSREPVLVYEFTQGETLYDVITSRFPEGIAVTRALRIAHELCAFLVDLHAEKWVYRNLDPRHVIVGHDDVIHMVGCGNAVRMNEAPNPTRATVESAYVAPEIRNEQSGKMLRPAADIYSLGALLTFMLTGEEPRSSVENPLTQAAFDRLSALDPPGVSLLVARCLRPMAKERFGRADRMLPYLNVHSLPTPSSDGFGLLQLPAPWTGAEPPERLKDNKLSAGPLVSVAKGAEDKPSTDLRKAENQGLQKKTPLTDRSTLAYIGFLLLALFLCVISILVPGI